MIKCPSNFSDTIEAMSIQPIRIWRNGILSEVQEWHDVTWDWTFELFIKLLQFITPIILSVKHD